MGTLHVYVDDEQCFGYQRCVQAAPKTFSLNETGNSVAGPPADDEEAIREAAWACPMQAIVVTDDSQALQPVEHGDDASGEPRHGRRTGDGPAA